MVLLKPDHHFFARYILQERFKYEPGIFAGFA
jgi:hypothetical protein